MKFQSFIKYFDWLEERAVEQENAVDSEKAEGETKTDDSNSNSGGGDQATTATTPPIDTDAKNTIKISRKVFSGKQWLTIEDWLECTQPLCRLEIKHEGRIERSHDECVQTIFASPRLGGNILSDGWSQVRIYCPLYTWLRTRYTHFRVTFKLTLLLLSIYLGAINRNAWHLHCTPN